MPNIIQRTDHVRMIPTVSLTYATQFKAAIHPSSHRPSAVVAGSDYHQGPHFAADVALLAPLLGFLHDDVTAEKLAKRLVQSFGGLERIVTAATVDLHQVAGVTAPTARLLQVQADMANALALRRAAPRQRIGSMSAVVAHIQPHLAHLKVETARALFLNARNALIGEEEVGKGTVNGVTVYPREVARHALLHHATAVVLAHNHPSGDATPSTADLEMTEQVRRALAALEIALHDHLIIAGGDLFSFRSAGLLRKPRRASGVPCPYDIAT
jgi:DNA repair protein RadC